MLKIATFVQPSPVHGNGLFTEHAHPAGTVLWAYRPGLDMRVPLDTAHLHDVHFGYVNPRQPEWLIYCGDKARWWNFPPEGTAPNAIEGEIDVHGEAVIIAARDLAAGEELLIDPASDADAYRKLAHQAVHTPQLTH